MQDLAEQIGVSVEQLSFYFSMKVKKKFRTWRKELRIKEAMLIIIRHPDLPVKKVGLIVGITDKSNFRREFSEVAGCYPTEWRDRRKKGLLAILTGRNRCRKA